MHNAQSTPADFMVTASQLASELQVSERTVRRWLAEGRISAIRITARTVRFSLADVLATIGGRSGKAST
jgi:excisionase family DNA binding protein